jgi:hypothetical protein
MRIRAIFAQHSSKARGKREANRVIRGGSWNNNAQNCRSAIRNNNEPDNRNNNLGFRLSSSQQRPDAVCLRIHCPCYALTIAPDLFQRMLDK